MERIRVKLSPSKVKGRKILSQKSPLGRPIPVITGMGGVLRDIESKNSQKIDELSQGVLDQGLALNNEIIKQGAITSNAIEGVRQENVSVFNELGKHILANNPHGITKETIGLNRVENTSDIEKPVSIPVQIALNTKANKEDLIAIENKIEESIKGQEKIKKDLSYSMNIIGGLGGESLVGGKTGQVLKKVSNKDGDYTWQNENASKTHNELEGRDVDNCHPISAITNLQTELNGKQPTIYDLDEIRAGASAGSTALQPSALDGYATETWVGQQGYLTGITSSDVTTAIGYTPQQQLVSGTNIKTINGNSLLGSGEISTSDSTKANTSLDNLSSSGQAIIDSKANTSLDNLTSVGKNIGNWSSNVTNCITYIPQDIKLELDNGTLTLKAGSKVYVPNGFEQDGTTPKFDEVTIESDLTWSLTTYGTGKLTFCVSSDGSQLIPVVEDSQTSSGSTQPTEGGGMAAGFSIWYDTTNNIVKYTANSFSTYTQVSLPIALVLNTQGTGMTSIDQVFNGFGYIGSTVFALPGVKGLIPNGRNIDGTLNSIPFTTSEVLISALFSGTWIGNVYINSNQILYTNTTTYNEEKNINEDSGGYIGANTHCCFGNHVVSNGSVTLLPKNVFHALDWKDGPYLSKLGMPSGRYIDLTLGASGSTYTAPANGYFTIDIGCNSGQYVNMQDGSNIYGINQKNYNGGTIRLLFPVLKGKSMYISYDASGPVYGFRFVYAKGEV